MQVPAIRSEQPPQVDKPARKPTFPPRVKRCLDIMVWDNKTDNEAAVQVGITVTSIRLALKQPHIRSYYREQLQVLRERESSRNIHTLIAVRDQTSNQQARINAVAEMRHEMQEAETGPIRHNSLPGLQIVVVAGGAAEPAIKTVNGTTLTQPDVDLIESDGKSI